MADKEKKVKKKKKEEAPAAEAPAPEPEPEPAPVAKRASSRGSRGSKKAKRSGSNVFSMFSSGQVAEFKEGFALMDKDKDGIIGKNDLRATFDSVGKLAADKELDEMLAEAPGPLNFTQLLSLFATRMSGGTGVDDDAVIIAAFKAFDEEGFINSETFKQSLMNWGDKFTEKEVDDCFDNFDVDDDGKIETAYLISVITASAEEE